MNTDNRQSKRLPFNHSAKFGQKNPPGRISFVTDLSEGGVCLKTNTVFQPGTKVYLSITVDGLSYEAEGVVAWAEKAPPALQHQVKGGMGIKFTDVDHALLEVYNGKLQISAHVEPERD